MRWRTRLTELLGCRYPIMEGAFAGIGTWEFAAAVSKTGAVGCITASACKTPD
ncbi:MAG: nitronate monooxygenase, partial [Candidatus Freyrarchaeum guaymaensis]